MATIRPLANVYSINGKKVVGEVEIPVVFQTPIRNDLIEYIFTNISKNTRHPYAVKLGAGYETSAESWGTGRAVARIPRVPGGGTHRAGQAAFGNMCRGGGMFNPTKIWRRWGRKVNLKEKRYAVCSSIAASGISSLVLARGHRISNLKEVPLVASNDIESIQKTKDALKFLISLGLRDEVNRLIKSKKIRAGKGKMRNRKYKISNGPLIIYNKDSGIKKAFRNIPGVDLCNVTKLNLLKLAPGGSIGRLCIWSEDAFKKLDVIYGKSFQKYVTKKHYILPKPIVNNADIYRIINSDQVQASLLDKKNPCKKRTQNKNSLTNFAVRCRLNPAYKLLRSLAVRRMKKSISENAKDKKEKKTKKKIEKKELQKVNNAYYNAIATSVKRKKQKEEKKAKSKKDANKTLTANTGDE
ncbi:60S ribosomal protein L4, putative [Plasmodium berghei]|uniref:Large ribosomal subunit protein uL4 n=2 Tax=Plasmodium berghei TaxID=5821 RepID=A0A509ALP7_PLABA|nr:60S ribosomal protein L4, putative [Plasmodium berghei ANKA]CXI60415.1 60S ribosomal protein L4, putative [Plasmodium berghei]SCM23563.1 60S ribosomal protein L4, putative [Plasmodium berghei]SCN26660.1 60S ribosomal protein L4, putative [Plasmodium berghei]SCO60928.1 60S ribosomal protein L4, putative [Plasmodium berghei]SCO62971.1 60S ribosomal protein L4, putative [Plasmodium berghei]|eukprot:XP_034422276.1 60S ribosomal protein L4, putative [Plasmodium berghei ANKA]